MILISTQNSLCTQHFREFEIFGPTFQRAERAITHFFLKKIWLTWLIGLSKLSCLGRGEVDSDSLIVPDRLASDVLESEKKRYKYIWFLQFFSLFVYYFAQILIKLNYKEYQPYVNRYSILSRSKNVSHLKPIRWSTHLT